MAQEPGTGKNHVDLHIHSTYSDGTSSVREIVEMAFVRQLKAIAITDHDCITGCAIASDLGKGLGLEVIPGVELSSEIDGLDIHILGYFVDVNNETLIRQLDEMKAARYIRAQKIVENLNRQGIDLRFETVLNIAGEAAIGRPHIAAAMLKEEFIYSFREAFDKYIGYSSPAYVEKMSRSPADVFRLVLDAGGLPVLAHPGVTKVDERIPAFIRDGLAGIEAYHAEHPVTLRKYYRRLCLKHDLAFTGGSDFHSHTQSRSELGMPRIAYSAVESLREKYRAIHGREPSSL